MMFSLSWFRWKTTCITTRMCCSRRSSWMARVLSSDSCSAQPAPPRHLRPPPPGAIASSLGRLMSRMWRARAKCPTLPRLSGSLPLEASGSESNLCYSCWAMRWLIAELHALLLSFVSSSIFAFRVFSASVHLYFFLTITHQSSWILTY